MSCQDLCMYSPDANAPDFFNRKTVRAAKWYRCCECGDPINKGEQHEYISGKWEGDIGTFRTCLPCAESRDTFYCDGGCLGGLWEDVYDQMFPEWDEVKAIDCLARLKTDAAVAKMRARYAEFQEATND